MPEYKFYYFDVRGRGELGRLLFAAAGVKFEDIRIKAADLPKIKPTLPFGGMPVLEVDGVRICQSLAINRYIARQHGLGGDTPLDQARADMVVECIAEISLLATNILHSHGGDAEKAKLVKVAKEKSPNLLAMLEKILAQNDDGTWFVGNKLSWADIALIDMAKWLESFHIDVNWDAIPKLKALRKRTEAIPKIAEYIAARPHSDI